MAGRLCIVGLSGFTWSCRGVDDGRRVLRGGRFEGWIEVG